ncbi:hypothetical protein GALMADRAFT_220834 [Galerina marginata CBS 339.88]|uniref:Uncharacterized protein n=1 Tax=Galerina marginata (strain CBS 339.88) TaxID=685588 RepID=A0A067TV09_GALM3|nr:hypothetical protein GALMADRAFT_220834 [Galerina marginata CBS 339.88]
MATTTSTVILSVFPTNFMTFQVPAGVSKLATPISTLPGGTMKCIIQRDGQTMVELYIASKSTELQL